MKLAALALAVVLASIADAQTTTQPTGAPPPPSPSPAWPAEFRGVSFGASQVDAEKMLGPMKCTAVADVPDTKRCWTTDKKKAFKIDEVVVKTFYFFNRDRFLRVEMEESAPWMYNGNQKNLIAPLSSAFEQKFGKPTAFSGGGQNFSTIWRSAALVAEIEAGTEDVSTPYGDKISVQLLRRAVISSTEWDAVMKAAQANKVTF